MLEGQSFIAELDAARFRGEFLQCCAEIEDHLCAALSRLVELGASKRAPYLFGQKFDLVRKSVGQPGLWKHSDHVHTVLLELQPFVELRGALGHAIIGPATIDGEGGIYWQPPGNRHWIDRRTITSPEMQATLQNLRHLTKKFRKQPFADNS